MGTFQRTEQHSALLGLECIPTIMELLDLLTVCEQDMQGRCGDLITVVSRKGRRVRYRDKFGKRHVVTVQEHCFSERNLTARISSNLEIRD